MRVGNKDGAAIVESDQVDLKIMPNREVFVRHGKLVNGRWTKPTNYKSTGRTVERDMSMKEKQIFLVMLRSKVLERMDVSEEENDNGGEQ